MAFIGNNKWNNNLESYLNKVPLVKNFTVLYDDQNSYQDTLLNMTNNSLSEWYVAMNVPMQWVIEHSTDPPSGKSHILMGILLSLIGIIGGVGNALVLIVYARFQRFRSPSNTFIVNLAVSDFLSALFHSMAAYSSFAGLWKFDKAGCYVYGSGIGLLGLVSIVTLLCISVERLIVIRPYLFPRWRITVKVTYKIIVVIWLYCVALAAPPLFGWSAYIPEGFLTSCSWDYLSRTSANRAYYVYLLVGGFVLPCSAIVYCYTCIIVVLLHHVKDSVQQQGERVSILRRNDIKTAQMVFALILLFTISWTPYAIISMIGQFGDKKKVSACIASLPALFAKASIVYNPIIYGMSHPHFRSSLRSLFHSNSTSSSHQHKLSVPVTYPARTTPRNALTTSLHMHAHNMNHGNGQKSLSCCLTTENYRMKLDSQGLDKRKRYSLVSNHNVSSEPDMLRLQQTIESSSNIPDNKRWDVEALRAALYCSESSLIMCTVKLKDKRQAKSLTLHSISSSTLDLHRKTLVNVEQLQRVKNNDTGNITEF